MSLALFKLRQFILILGFQPKSLPQMAMMLEVIASLSNFFIENLLKFFLVRILAVADSGAKNVFTTEAVLSFYYTHYYIIVTVSLITGFYW
jgi:hypothetical protein